MKVEYNKEPINESISPYIYPAVKVELNAEIVLNRICRMTRTSPNDVKSKKRGAELVSARRLFMLIERLRGFSQTKASEYINRDRTSCIHHMKKVQDFYYLEPDTKEQVDTLVNEFMLQKAFKNKFGRLQYEI